MGKQIRVKKGNEVLEIQDTDLQSAVNDGYLPTERIVVANSKTKETFEIDPQDLPSAFKDGFSFQDVSKKKVSTNLSTVGGKAATFGGQVGSSAPLSEREKIANYVKTLGGGVKQVSGDKNVGNLKSITQTKTTKKPETTFDQTKEEAVSGGINKINEIMYDTNDDWKDPIKVSLEKSVDRTQGNKSNLEYLAANVITRDAILKSGYNASKMLQTTPIWAMAKPGENMTADLLKQKTAEFKNKVQPFEGIELNELDNGEGGGNDEFYKYVYGDKIYNAAIKAHALKNPNFKDQLLAKGATYEDFENGDLMKFVPSGKLGQIVSESVYDPDVAEYLKNEKPYLFNGLKAIASSLIEDDKDFGANVVANKISREFLKKRKLSPLEYVADFATQELKDEINEFAKANLTEQEYRVYQNRILGNEERYIDTPSLLEGFASGGKQIFSGIKSTFTTPFKSQSEIIDEGWKQEASNVSADPEGIMKFLRDSGHTLGIVGGIASLGGPLGGGGTGFYATKVVPALSGTIPFLGDMLQEGTMKYPDSPVKAWTSAMFNTALYAALSYRIFPAKDVEKAFTAVKPEIAVVVKNLTNGSITREVARKEMNTIAVKALNFLSGTQIKSGKIAAELTGISALNQMLDKVMGMDDKTYEKYHPEGELSDTFGSLFLSNQFVGGLAKYGEMKRGNRIVEASLYEAASNPLKFQREVELLKTKDESIDTNQILDNLKFLTEVKKELDARGIKPANQGRYMFEAMKEKVFADAVKSTPDSNMIRPMKESIKRGEEIKASILEGEDVVGNEQFELQKENKALSADQIAIQKALEGKEIKDTLFASIAESAMKDPELAAQLVADIKSQATGEVAGEIGSAKSGQINSFGEGLVEYAINKKAGEPERPKVEAGSVGVGGDVMKGVNDKMRQTKLEMEFKDGDALSFKNEGTEIVIAKPIGADGKYSVTISKKSNSNTGFTINEGKTKLFDTKLEALDYAKELKEQSLKETPQEGSVGVGGELADEDRIERRKKNENITTAPGSTYYSDVNLKNSKIGDEIHYEEYKDGKFIKHKTKVKDIVGGEVIFENGQSQKDVSSYMNITAEDAWFAKNQKQSLREQPKAGSVGVEGDVEGFVGGTKIYRAGGKGRYFTTDKQYIQEGGFKGETREFEIPENTKLLDLREEDYKGILDLATEEERSILRKPQAKNSIEAKEQGNIVDAILKRNGYDGYIIKDAGETKDFDTVVFRKDKSPDLKAVEQSLKETPQEGSVGVEGDVVVGAKPKPIDEQSIAASQKWIKDLYSLPDLTRIQDKNGNIYDIKGGKIRKLTLDKEGNVINAEIIHTDRDVHKRGAYSNPDFFNEGYRVLPEQSPKEQLKAAPKKSDIDAKKQTDVSGIEDEYKKKIVEVEEKEKPVSGITHFQTKIIEEELGMPEYESTPETQIGWNEEADKKINEGYDIKKLFKSIDEENHVPNKVEQKILAKYVGMLKDKAEKDPSDENLKQLKKAISIADKVGSESGRSLVARKGVIPIDDSLAGMFIMEMEASNVEVLTDAQKATVVKEFEEIKKAKEEYAEKLAKLQEEHAKLLANQNIQAIKSRAAKQRKTDQDFAKERKQIIDGIRQKLKESRSQTSAVAIPYAKELIAIAPDVAKLTKSLVEQGVYKLEDIVSNIHEVLSPDISGITKKDVQDIVAGLYDVKKPLRKDIAFKLSDLKEEAALLSELENLVSGGDVKSESEKVKRNVKFKEIKDKIKSFSNLDRDLKKEKEKLLRKNVKDSQKLDKELQKAEFELGIDLESDYVKELVESVKRKTAKQIKDVENQLKSGDFAKKGTPKLPLDSEAKELKKKLVKLKQEREVRILKEEYNKRNSLQKFRDKVAEVFNVPRALMASTDFSAPLNQAIVATISNPKMAFNSLKQMFKSAFSQDEFDNWFFDLKEDPRYELMRELKLGITDPHSPFLTAREEAFMSGYAEMIGDIPGRALSKVTGKKVGLNLIKGSERAYVQYLNKMRVDLFNRFVDRFEEKGLSYEKNKKLYQSAAKYVNNITGRGDLGKIEAYAPVFNAMLFSPRLMAARINMLNPVYFARLPREIKNEYIKDMSKFIGTGSLILSLFALYGKTKDDEDEDKVAVELDPTSTDFAKIRQGNTSWNIWGGFQPYVRVAAQLGFGRKKSVASGQTVELDGEGAFGESRSDVITRFFRGKLSPVPSMTVDVLSGKTLMGEDVTFKEEAYSHLMPLSAQGAVEAFKDKGVQSIFTTALPAVFGIGTQVYQEKKKEVPDKVPFDGKEVKLTEEQKEFFQQTYDKQLEIWLKKAKSINGYKDWSRNEQVAAESQAKRKAMTVSREIIQKKYRGDFKKRAERKSELRPEVEKNIKKALRN